MMPAFSTKNLRGMLPVLYEVANRVRPTWFLRSSAKPLSSFVTVLLNRILELVRERCESQLALFQSHDGASWICIRF